MEVPSAEEVILRANFGPECIDSGLDSCFPVDAFPLNPDDFRKLEELIDPKLFKSIIQDEIVPPVGGIPGGGIPQSHVPYQDGSRNGSGASPMDNPALKGSPQRVPPSTHPGPPQVFHPVHNIHGNPQHLGQQGPPPQGGVIGSKTFCNTQFPESPPDSGSEPYSPPNDHNQQPQSQDPPVYNIKANGMPQMPQGGHHPMYMGGHGPPTGPPQAHQNGPPTGPPNIIHSSVSPPHNQHQSPPHQQPNGNPMSVSGHPQSTARTYMYPGATEPLSHMNTTNPMNIGQPLNVAQLMSNPNSSMNNLSNQPAKKRKHSGSPNGTFNPHIISQMVQCIPPSGMLIKQEPGVGQECDDDYSYDMGQDPSLFMEGTFQVIKWQPFQQNKWVTLLDDNGKELSSVNYRVDADKGFNYSPSDEAFVCQKKNHFQVTVHIGISETLKYIKTPEGVVKPVDSLYLHFNGIKAESTSQSIRVEQSQSDRTKRAFHPVKVELSRDQVHKLTVGRLHFSETTSNNMRKKGKPNPDQRYFMLVVSLQAHNGTDHYQVAAQKSERIIVRASNPGQFDSDVDVLWNKGRTPDSVVHLGRVGINTESPDEALTIHGNVHLTGHLVQTSDQRAKTNIKELDPEQQLQNVKQIRVYNYDYKAPFADYAGITDDEKKDTGVLAQQLVEVLPDAVKETGDIILPDGELIENFMVVDKDRIFMESLGAVKELCKVTDKLESRIIEIEGMNKTLKTVSIKRDSMKSTCSTYSYSTCSTISRTNSIPPSEKKPSKSSQPLNPDMNDNNTNNPTSPRRHHHHHQHRHHHHNSSSSRCGNNRSSSSSPSSSSPRDRDSGPCNNRLIQIIVIILVLVMAFCLISITVLYILERKAAPPHSHSTPAVQDIPGVNSTNSLMPTTPTSSSESSMKHNGSRPALTPPRCQKQPCNIVCCTGAGTSVTANPAGVGPTNNDPARGAYPPTKKPRKDEDNHNNINPVHKLKNDTANKDVPYQILPTVSPKARDQPVQVAANKGVGDDDGSPGGTTDTEPSNEIPRKNHPNDTKYKKPEVVVHSGDQTMNDPIVDNEIIDDPQDDYGSHQVQTNQPHVVVMDPGGVIPYTAARHKRAASMHNRPAQLQITQINKTIDSVYCINESLCDVGGNYSYYIPISSVFPKAFITIDFLLIEEDKEYDVKLCEEVELNGCRGQPDQIKAAKGMKYQWDLPIGYYFETYFKFRVAAKNEGDICSRDVSEAGTTYSEYNLSFHRLCDDH